MTRAYIGLGANLGHAADAVQQAINALDQIPDTVLVAASRLYHSAPVGYADQPDFVNAVACVDTQLDPHSLLEALFDIEHRFGRERTFRNAPRTLDMDVLLYGDLSMHDDRLTIPHPRMHERGFVLLPLQDIAPGLTLPGHGDSRTLLQKIETSDLRPVADNGNQ
ncbi:2-amino-4-hydroxy-6-hydroxymethyldihydropteridine diphosphokinase [Burkholderiaceae bacterium DAT-1]|nr:2-amino-4-hydroxy-6-hydroxymethyldihydropteridine diphosphokinase [Burkholderiaceae bacterium DAT-1]